ncbi:MAG: hypothetical protein AAB482_03210 [Patescibacteria group bacterium]
MLIATITKRSSRSEKYVEVPRKVYEEFLAWRQNNKSYKTVKPTKSELQAIARGRKNFKEGKYVTLQQLKHELAHNR